MNLKQPDSLIIGLSPMDGVTDAAYRYIQKKHGNPDVMMTEFVHVIGVCQGSERLLTDFIYDEIERPVLAQIYGSQPEYFYHAAKIIAALGFDGVDINMGCPARGVVYRGGGAALINTPELAKDIVKHTRKGFTDYFETGELTGLKPEIEAKIKQMAAKHEEYLDREEQVKNFTLSVKTRIGFDSDVVQDWVKHLTEVEPEWIAIHGRTLKQMYMGHSDWEAVGSATEVTHIPIWGNGDIKTANDAVRMFNETGVKGVLIGRGSYGNPWLFKQKDKIKQLETEIPEYQPTMDELLELMLEHTNLHWNIKGEKAFVQMRKNLAWYIKGFPGASEFRARLVRVNNPEEVAQIVEEIKAVQN